MGESKFKIGNRVVIRKDSQYYGTNRSNPADVEGVVTSLSSSSLFGGWIRVTWNNDRCNSYTEKDLELIKSSKKEEPMNILKELKSLTMSKGDRLMVKYNIVDDCGDLTDEGTAVLLRQLLDANKDAIVDKLTELDKKKKAEKK